MAEWSIGDEFRRVNGCHPRRLADEIPWGLQVDMQRLVMQSALAKHLEMTARGYRKTRAPSPRR